MAISKKSRKGERKKNNSVPSLLSRQFRRVLRSRDMSFWLVCATFVLVILSLSSGTSDFGEFIERSALNNKLALLLAIGVTYILLFVFSIYVIILRPSFLFQGLFKSANVILLILTVTAIAVRLYVMWENQEFYSKVIIEIADFVGPDPDRYHVTEEVASEINTSLTIYGDVRVIPLKRTLTRQEIVSESERLGRRCQGALIIWGTYTIQSGQPVVTSHVENATPCFSKVLGSPVETSLTRYIEEAESLEILEQMSNGLPVLTSVVSGTARYLKKDYSAAIPLLTSALNTAESADVRAILFMQRGNAYFFLAVPDTPKYDAQQSLSKLQNARSDFSGAIRLKPNYARAYVFRGITYFGLHQFQESLDDFNEAIKINPQDETAYFFRGLLYEALQKSEKAIGDFRQVLEISPDGEFGTYAKEEMLKLNTR